MILFYTSGIIDASSLLEADEFMHCIKVLRHKLGDIIHITDGNGIQATAEIIEIKKSQAALRIIESESIKKSLNKFHLAIAPPKNRNRWEWILEKSVEIGVDNIIPLKSKNSERTKFNLERGQKIVRSAALQSLRPYHPALQELCTFENLIKDYDDNWNKLIAHYREDNIHINQFQSDSNNHIIIVGPEGDFSPNEIEEAMNANFKLVNISNNRLRTETAGVVAINLLVSKYE